MTDDDPNEAYEVVPVEPGPAGYFDQGAEGEGAMRSVFRVRDARQTDLKREFGRRGHAEWQWGLAALIAFSILDYLYGIMAQTPQANREVYNMN
jgi:hypothetical protein